MDAKELARERKASLKRQKKKEKEREAAWRKEHPPRPKGRPSFNVGRKKDVLKQPADYLPPKTNS